MDQPGIGGGEDVDKDPIDFFGTLPLDEALGRAIDYMAVGDDQRHVQDSEERRRQRIARLVEKAGFAISACRQKPRALKLPELAIVMCRGEDIDQQFAATRLSQQSGRGFARRRDPDVRCLSAQRLDFLGSAVARVRRWRCP
jgi:hypothetical protein